MSSFLIRKTLAAMAVALPFAVAASTAQAQTFDNVPALSFTTVVNGANPLPQIVTIASTGNQFTFSATPSTSSGGSWLTVTPSGGECCNTPEGITISANAASLDCRNLYRADRLRELSKCDHNHDRAGDSDRGAGQRAILRRCSRPSQLFHGGPTARPPSQVIQIENGGTGPWTGP